MKENKLNIIVDSCRFLLNNFPAAQECKEYLDSRLNKDSQELFQFGYFPTIKDLAAITSLIGEDILKETKLFYTKNIEDSCYPRTINFSFFDNHSLIMPYKNAYGEVVALVGRSLLTEDERKLQSISKYKNTVFKKSNFLFGLNESKKSIIEKDLVYVVEGQFDLIKAIECGIKNIVALGNSNMTNYQFSILTRYTNNIVLLLDNDEAGDIGRKRIVELFGKHADIRNSYLPKPYKDIDEFLSSNSSDSLSFIC
jgi:DNA primase catalytic core